jgi:uncharacterized protein DUF6728
MSLILYDLDQLAKKMEFYIWRRLGQFNQPALGKYFIFFLNWHMGIFRQIAEYLYIKKPDPNAPRSQWMKYMHGINRISIFMFLAGIVLLLIRIFFWRR